MSRWPGTRNGLCRLPLRHCGNLDGGRLRICITSGRGGLLTRTRNSTLLSQTPTAPHLTNLMTRFSPCCYNSILPEATTSGQCSVTNRRSHSSVNTDYL